MQLILSMSTCLHKKPFLKVHFTLLPVCCYYLPREELQLHLAGYQKLFRTSTVPKGVKNLSNWNCRRELHVQNTELKHSQSRWTHPSTHEKFIQLLKVAKPVFGHIEDLIFNCNSHCHNLTLCVKSVKQGLNATTSQSQQRLYRIYAQAYFAWA